MLKRHISKWCNIGVGMHAPNTEEEGSAPNTPTIGVMQRWSIWWSSGLLVQRGRNRVNCRGGWDLWREQPLYRARESTNTGSGQRHLLLTQGCSLRHHHQSQSSWFVQIPSDQQHGVAKSMSECASKCGSNWQRAKC